jgi:hypothetical protein
VLPCPASPWFSFFFFFFGDRVSLYSSGCPGTHSVDQAGLELRNPPASASRVLGLKACATTPSFTLVFSSICLGLIVHEGSSVYRIFKRWQAVNQQWKVLNYDKTKDVGGDTGGGAAGKPGPRTSRTSPPAGAPTRPPAAQRMRMRTLLPQRCGYTILHLLGQLRPPDARSSSHSGREVVMRVTTV